MSQLELAKACGVSKGYISQLELGRNPTTGSEINPKVTSLQKLAKGLRVSYETLERLARNLPPTSISGPDGQTTDVIYEKIDELPLTEAHRKTIKQTLRAMIDGLVAEETGTLSGISHDGVRQAGLPE